MKVLKLIFFFLFILKNSATGQIVTPSLDASVLSLMPASAGWRDETNFNGSFESFAETDLEGNESKTSDVVIWCHQNYYTIYTKRASHLLLLWTKNIKVVFQILMKNLKMQKQNLT